MGTRANKHDRDIQRYNAIDDQMYVGSLQLLPRCLSRPHIMLEMVVETLSLVISPLIRPIIQLMGRRVVRYIVHQPDPCSCPFT